jgi:hypothetical protein
MDNLLKPPAFPPPFREPAPPAGSPPVGSSLSIAGPEPQNVREPSPSGLPPQPEPFRSPNAEHLMGSLSVPEPAAAINKRMGLERLTPSSSVFHDRPSEVVTVADHRQLHDHSRRSMPR